MNSQENSFLDWEMLNYDGKIFKDFILEEWKDIENSNDIDTLEVKDFFSTYAGFFFRGDIITIYPVVVSNLNLGNNIVDFITTYDDGSYGFKYTLIKVLHPRIKPIIDKKISKECADAISEILEWRKWVNNNISEAISIMPSSSAIIHGDTRFRYKLIIGSRNISEYELYIRNSFSTRTKIEIRSFNKLIEGIQVHNPILIEFPNSFSKYIIPDEINNKFANPFYKSMSNSDWIDILNHPRFERLHHMSERNIELILTKRKFNKYYDSFLKYLNKRNYSPDYMAGNLRMGGIRRDWIQRKVELGKIIDESYNAFRTKIDTFIKEDKVEDALTLLELAQKEYMPNNSTIYVTLYNRWVNLNKNHINGLITLDNYLVERNKWLQSFMFNIDQFKNLM